jgi:predicted site-specific integrase-resolvase
MSSKPKRGDEELLSAMDAAELLGLARITIIGYINRGLLPARKVAGAWILRASDVKAFKPRRVGRHEVPAVVRTPSPTSVKRGKR